MAAIAGRKVRVKYDADGVGAGTAVEIARARADSGTINNEPIDITAKDDAGWRTLLNDVGVKSVDLSVSGILTNDTLLELSVDTGEGTALHVFELELEGIGTLRGSFFIGSYESGGNEGAEAATFSCSLMSSGEITYTAAS